MPIVTEYSSNNSGGSFWLKDEEWKSLEDHGWFVQWLKDDDYYKYHLCPDGRCWAH